MTSEQRSPVVRTYRAVIWTSHSESGRRVSVQATSLREAMTKLEGRYGTGTVFDLHNENDAARPRQPTDS